MELPKYRKKQKVIVRGKEYIVERVHLDKTGYWYSLVGYAPVFHESELLPAWYALDGWCIIRA